MKTIISNSIDSIGETVKRTIYSFQVLMVGIAIPVLFIIGISNANQKKQVETQTEQVTNSSQLPTNPVVGFPVVEI
ncbi:MAG TPA: hypothetical protein VIJ92_06475 [Ginsengibacter sp.]